MLIDIDRAVSFLTENDGYTVIAHAHPDGDTLGSGFALCLILRALGKKANVICNDSIPGKFSYLTVDNDEFEEKCVIAVDIADTSLMGAEIKAKYEGRVDLCIDHHGSNKLFAAQTLLDPNAAATAEIIFTLAEKLNVEITQHMADCLYTGISTDTGCFRYSNVTSGTHKMAARLMELGADVVKINVLMFETKTKSYAVLEKLAIESMEFFYDGKCVVIYVTQEMFKKSGSDESECDALAALPRQIEGVLIGVMLREKLDGSFKASVRTHSPVNAAALCAKMGGGGHANAAGCQLFGTMEQAKEELIRNIGAVI